MLQKLALNAILVFMRSLNQAFIVHWFLRLINNYQLVQIAISLTRLTELIKKILDKILLKSAENAIKK